MSGRVVEAAVDARAPDRARGSKGKARLRDAIAVGVVVVGNAERAGRDELQQIARQHRVEQQKGISGSRRRAEHKHRRDEDRYKRFSHAQSPSLTENQKQAMSSAT